MLASLALISLLQAPTLGAGDLSLTNVRFTYGILGPTRPDTKVRPGDGLYLSFDIQGITTDDAGKASYTTAVEVSDGAGKPLFKQPSRKFQEYLVLGGDSLPAFATIDLGLDSPSGEYNLKVTVTDTASNKSTSVSVKFEMLPKAFDLVRIAITGDGDGLVPIGAYSVGQPFWFHAAVVGFDRGKNAQPKITVQLRVLDDAGKPIVAKPFTGSIEKDVPANAPSLPVRFYVPLNKTGKFTIEVIATDELKMATVSKKFPLNVISNK